MALDRFLANMGLTPELQICRAAAAARTEEGTDLQGEADAVHAAAAAGGEIFELRLQHSVTIFSLVLGAAGALYRLMIDALCNNPS